MKPYIFVVIFFGVLYLIELISILKVLLKHLPPLKRIKITIRINLVIFLTGLLMLAIVLLFDINYIQYSSPIPHSNWKTISLNDFKGLKRPSQTLDGEKDFAFIVCNFQVKEVADGIEIISLFHPSRSYVFNQDTYDNKLLTHEIYHFHITEYCARLLRQDITLSKLRFTDTELKAAINKYRIVEDSLQFQYDDETYHSYLAGKQKKWERKVDSCLLSLENYKNSFLSNK